MDKLLCITTVFRFTDDGLYFLQEAVWHASVLGIQNEEGFGCALGLPFHHKLNRLGVLHFPQRADRGIIVP